MLTKYRESSSERTISYILTVFPSTSFLDSETICVLTLRDYKFKSRENPCAGPLLLVILPFCHETKSWKQVMDSNPEWESGINRDFSSKNIFSELRSEKLRMMEGLLLLVILPSCHETKSWKQVMEFNPEWDSEIKRDCTTDRKSFPITFRSHHSKNVLFLFGRSPSWESSNRNLKFSRKL